MAPAVAPIAAPLPASPAIAPMAAPPAAPLADPLIAEPSGLVSICSASTSGGFKGFTPVS